MIESGTTLQQRYRIDKQIGQGGMGAVYVATDERFGSIVAIKETLCMDDNFLKAIEREARLFNSLKHPALPRVSDHFLENEGQFLVMEYIQGEDLCCMLDGMGKAFDLAQVLKWTDQLLDALDYLHNQTLPVIHRDIKPQNLKITAGGQIILLDFGLAKGNPTDAGHATAAKSIFGYSRNYASLEQIQGTGTDPRSDLYSLAATLYHLMTNTAPEDALTRAMSVLSKKPDPLVPANLIDPRIPRGVAGVLQKALDLNADERPSSAAEMRQMFRESEKYGYLTDAVTVSANAGDTGMFAQPTKLMADSTRARDMRQTDLKTDVRSAAAHETSVAPGISSADTGESVLTRGPAQKRRGMALALGTLLVLIVGGAVAGGLYMNQLSDPGVGNETEKSLPSLPLANTNSAVNGNIDSPHSGVETLAADNSNLSAPTENTTQTEKAPETTKGIRTIEKPKTQVGEDETVDINGDPENPDEVTIRQRDKNGKVTTMTVRPNEMPNIPTPPAAGYDPFPNKLERQNLTPEQIRKLIRLRRMANAQQTPN